MQKSCVTFCSNELFAKLDKLEEGISVSDGIFQLDLQIFYAVRILFLNAYLASKYFLNYLDTEITYKVMN